MTKTGKTVLVSIGCLAGLLGLYLYLNRTQGTGETKTQYNNVNSLIGIVKAVW